MLDDFVFECTVVLKDGRNIFFSNLYIYELFNILDTYVTFDVEDIKIRKFVESDK